MTQPAQTPVDSEESPVTSAATAPIGSTVARMLWGFVGVTVGYLTGTFLIFGLQAELSDEIVQTLSETTFFPIIGGLFAALLAVIFGVLISWAGERWYRVVSRKRALAREGRPY